MLIVQGTKTGIEILVHKVSYGLKKWKYCFDQ